MTITWKYRAVCWVEFFTRSRQSSSCACERGSSIQRRSSTLACIKNFLGAFCDPTALTLHCFSPPFFLSKGHVAFGRYLTRKIMSTLDLAKFRFDLHVRRRGRKLWSQDVLNSQENSAFQVKLADDGGNSHRPDNPGAR